MELPPAVPDVLASFTESVIDAFDERVGERFTLFLSGGPTARLCYEQLASTTNGFPEVLDWSLVDIYMGDERYVPPEDHDANQRLVREALLDGITPARVGSFTPMPTALAVDECVASYQETIREVLDGPGIDLIHLGLGVDGHTASLFANDRTLSAGPDELVASTSDPNGVNPHPRITLTLPVINTARSAVFTVCGPTKAEAVAALRRGDDLPASRVKAERIIWLVDAAASAPSP